MRISQENKVSGRTLPFNVMRLALWVLLIFGVALPAAHAQDAITPPGDGLTTDTAYQISQLGHLVWMSDKVTASSGKYYKLMNDIDASDTTNWNDSGTDTSIHEGFKPIGTSSSPAPDTTSFMGIFDGGGHSIIDLIINRQSTSYIGLFGRIGTGGKVKNLGLEGGGAKGLNDVGCLAGINCGTITNCHAAAWWVHGNGVGGLVGVHQSGAIINCYSTGEVYQWGSVYDVGGLIGIQNGGAITNCYATGNVGAESGSYVGGLVGRKSYGTITACYATGTVTGGSNGSRGDYVGGLIGSHGSGTITACYATGEVWGRSDVGGMVGGNSSSGAITNCYATGGVTCSSGSYVGGLIGSNGGTITYCYATGTVTGSSVSVGGLVGSNSGGTITNCYACSAVTGSNNVGGLTGSNGGSISHCFATGAVTGSNYVGGLVGNKNGGTATYCYWDEQSSGRTSSAGGTGKTTAQMKQQITFVGWDFMTVWGNSLSVNSGYPYLLFNDVSEIVPRVLAFAINNGAFETTNRSVTLNNARVHAATEYLASETADFNGVAWQPYAIAPVFTLSTGNGTKAVYFKVRNTGGESSVTSDTIALNEPVPQTWVKFDYVGQEDGTQALPFNTLGEGIGAVDVGGTVRIFIGSTAGAIYINKHVRLEAWGGLVRIGRTEGMSSPSGDQTRRSSHAKIQGRTAARDWVFYR